jgi:homoserine dehydrogenase
LKDIRILLLGFGNVGQALLRLLEEHDGYRDEGASISLHSVFDRGGGIRADFREAAALVAAKREKKTVAAFDGARSLRLEEALEETREEGILVDTSITNADTGGPGLVPARRALERGTSVVFASKGPLVAAFDELSGLARAGGARIGASAAVGIPLPGLEVGVLGLRGAGIRRFRGVLNDTTNQILRDLESGISLQDSVARARLAGTIEEDPRLDLEGWDAAYKLLILASVIWKPTLSLGECETRGVSAIGKNELDQARSRRKRIRLVATAGPERRGDSSPHGARGARRRGSALSARTGGESARVRDDHDGHRRPPQQQRGAGRDRRLRAQGRLEPGSSPTPLLLEAGVGRGTRG